ncbi:MAG: Gfo/Idh/MocA family oxidoreductase [Opitutaceae bacterium]
MPDQPPTRWGILGTGGIARKFAKALNETPTGVLTAVGSRSGPAARGFAEEFGAGRAHASYDELLRDAEVDAVYISLPNHLHAEWTIRAATAGKHILCEKPFAVNAAEARRAMDFVRESGVFFMEAFMYRCHPQTKKIVDLIVDGAIGEVRLIQAGFTYNMGLNFENIRLSHEAAGGGIMDVGCYPVSMCRLIAGAARRNPFQNPSDVRGVAWIGEVSHVDQQAAAVLKFPGGLVATVAAATQVGSDNVLRVYGSEGSLVVPVPWAPSENSVIHLIRNGKEPEEIRINAARSLYTHEIDLLAECVRRRDREAPPPAMTWADTIGNMEVLDAWRKDIGLVFKGD